MKIGFHGTSKESAFSILENGYKQCGKNWTTSLPNCYIFHSDDTNSAFQLAFNQGMNRSLSYKKSYRAVIAIDIDGLDIVPDFECHPHECAWRIISEWNTSRIVGIWGDIYDISPVKPFMKFIMKDKIKLMNTINANPVEKIIGENIKQLEMFPDIKVPIKKYYDSGGFCWDAPSDIVL